MSNKYFWGDDAFPVHLYVPVVFALTAIVPILLEYVVTPTAPGIELGMELMHTKFTVLTTLLWISILFNGFGQQVILKFAVKDGAQIGDGAFHVAERTVYNQMEQGMVFLPLLWVHCFYVDAGEAGALGLVYVCCRALYQIFYAYYGEFTFLVEFATQPAYSICYYFLFSLLCPIFFDDTKFATDVLPSSLLVRIPIFGAMSVFGHALQPLYGTGLPTGQLCAYLNRRVHEEQKKKD